MQQVEKINVFWFRRDLRLDDNTGLNAALRNGLPVMPLFIFDTNIISDLDEDDSRITFIHDNLKSLNKDLTKHGSSIHVRIGEPLKVWEEIISTFNVDSVFINKDYEPYALERERKVNGLLSKKGVKFKALKDQVIFEESEILASSGKPYTVFTPYKNSWVRKFGMEKGKFLPEDLITRPNFLKSIFPFPALQDLGFKRSGGCVSQYDLSNILEYDKYRNFPSLDRTTHLGPHLRFGIVSIRRIVEHAYAENQVFLGELIWREFFMQVLFNFPHVVTGNFNPKYDNIAWRNNEGEFRRWCNGETGYPIVDAGMRQLNETGYMHNRVRMITAGFLCKHLLTSWWFGEAYFAEKLNDYELSSNNGNWQWAAGTGCDAAPYFRIFNPETQQKKFDKDNEYIRKWVPEFGKSAYPGSMVDHEIARQRAIEAYKAGIRY